MGLHALPAHADPRVERGVAMKTLTRVGVGLGVTLFVLAAVAVTVFAIGTPVAPPAPSPGVALPEASPASTAAPSAAGAGPLAIEIPGCVCHSDDPQVVAEHAAYRMSECFDCHQDGAPAMGQ